MQSACSTSPSPPPPTAEEPTQEAAPPADEAVHKIKVIQFLGRTIPIVLQNNNGPCPLLAICNVLLLKNCLNLNPDVPEVSQEKLLSLVAERLIDSNSNTDNRDAEYVENQQQNIANAIDLLPRLTTGIDVNIKFRRIDNFEFTQECAIFDMLDIPLYHGWIVDPQDHETSNAIGSKSYNILMGELVALEAQSMKSELPKNHEEDSVDFAAATTATLGVPSPSISLVESHILRKEDIDEEAELVRALKLSETELVTPPVDDISMDNAHLSLISEESKYCENSELDTPADPVKGNHAPYIANDSTAKIYETGNEGIAERLPEKIVCSENLNLHNSQSQSSSAEPVIIAEEPDLFFQANLNSTLVEPKEKLIATFESYEHIPKFDMVQSCQPTNISEAGDLRTEPDDIDIVGSCLTPTTDPKASSYLDKPRALASDIDSSEPIYEGEECILDSKTCLTPTTDSKGSSFLTKPQASASASATDTDSSEPIYEGEDCMLDSKTSCTPTTDSKASSYLDKPQASASDIDSSEPIYEGEDCILDSKTESCQNQEPVYEGEVILAEQVDNMGSLSEAKPRSEMTMKEGEVVVNFLRSSASQLTIYGLFCLQDGMKERELCVFFRNNHFNTMFKFEGELYILVTDQGYINQPDLVWEKLNEVNGDTLYITGNFMEFKVDAHSTSTWDERTAMSSTADYLASIDISRHQQSNFNSDLQLAIALQQQEFEQQQAQRNNEIQQRPVSDITRVITPQAPRNIVKQTSTSYNSKQETKSSKEKCTVM